MRQSRQQPSEEKGIACLLWGGGGLSMHSSLIDLEGVRDEGTRREQGEREQRKWM